MFPTVDTGDILLQKIALRGREPERCEICAAHHHDGAGNRERGNSWANRES